jgi:hypothetical protein
MVLHSFATNRIYAVFSTVESATDTGRKRSWVDPRATEVMTVKVTNDAGNQTPAESLYSAARPFLNSVKGTILSQI